ncbi:class I SAM-dependent methyltransferase [bacterium]|nr:class I SAM-dependent methyltransferase [bacterium]MBU2529276.1 class I SAM-dependent methyltransferase [bacterium]MBU3930247.1 class I SAM-dependent methyltransferase [bacterium]
MYKEIKKCRICGNANLATILDLGNQYLTGIFPPNNKYDLTSGPLELVKCMDDGRGEACGLVQLRHSYDSEEMYGENYGYRSGLNQSMVRHLQQKVQNILKKVKLSDGDVVLDIGSNDSTLLQAYPHYNIDLIGMDPTGKKFKDYYPSYIKLVPDFFSAATFKKIFGDKKAKIITSIAMFYDLASPLDFVQDIYNSLDEQGVWVFEQSYLLSMLDANAYDTVCHEHLEYYGIKQIKWMCDKIGFRILDIEINNINGGSFSVMVCKKNAPYKDNAGQITELLETERKRELHTLAPYKDFEKRVKKHKTELLEFIGSLKKKNKKILGYGASTKGNVVLQYCGLTPDDIPFIAEVNKDKFGCYTPGTNIPIISESEAKKMKPDYLLVLPWHFKENILFREKEYLAEGGKFIFPLPEIEVV